MIVPRTRLSFWAAMVVVPCGLLSATYPGQAIVYVAVLGVFVVVAALDALRGGKALASIGVQLPEVARMSRDRRATFEVRVHNVSQKPCTVRLALVLPEEIESEQEETNVNLPGGHEWSRLTWGCSPRTKGIFRIK